MSENSDKEYRIERFTGALLHDLEALYHSVYATNPGNHYFARKYDTAYTGAEYVGYLAYNPAGIVIAFYGVVPCYLSYEGTRMLAAQSADTMTHPGHRYKGLFVELSEMTFTLCRSLSIRLLFGFPNQHSLPGAINKLHWIHTTSLDCFLLKVKSVPLEKIAGRFPALKKGFQRYVRRALPIVPADAVENSVLADGFAGVARDENYLRAKQYEERMVFSAGSAMLWAKVRNGLIVGDVQLNGSDPDELLLSVKSLARKIGVSTVMFHFSQGTTMHALFSARCEAIPSFPVLCRDFGSEIPLDRLKFSFADIDIF